MVPARVSFVTIGAADVNKLRDFYERLGWKVAMESDDFAAFETGGAILSIYSLASLTKDAKTDAPSGGFRGVTLAVNVEKREDVDAAFAAAWKAGAKILNDPSDQHWGGRSGYFADPEGNVWEIAWMPGSTFDARGALVLPKLK